MSEFLTILIFISALFTVLYILFFEDEMDISVRKRLEQIKYSKEEGQSQSSKMSNTDEIYEALEEREKAKKKNIIEMLKDQSEYRIPILGLILGKFQFSEKIKNLMKRADIKMPIDVFVLLINMFIAPFIVLAVLKNNIFIFIIGLFSGFIPFIFLQFKIKDRLKKFSQYFPDSLGIISNSLRAGHSLLASFQMVSNESPYPVNKLFKTVADEISLGRDVREALEDMNNHLPGSEDLKFFITAVLIQKEIGGNLAEILDTLNFTIREREKIEGMIKTQTAQAQLSGIVLGLAPAFITGVVALINPKYMEPLFETTMGNMALFFAFLMSLTGFLLIRKITQIRV